MLKPISSHFGAVLAKAASPMRILVDDNGPTTNGFRFEAEVVGARPSIFGFGDSPEEAVADIASKLGFDDPADMKHELVQRGEF